MDSYFFPDYKIYSKQIREEYKHVPDSEYRKRRSAVCRHMFRRRVYIGTESNNSSGRTKLHVNVEYSVTLFKHEMNPYFFRLIVVSIKKGRILGNFLNARRALLQTFSVLFSVDTLINQEFFRSISYHLIFNVFQYSKHLLIHLLIHFSGSEELYSATEDICYGRVSPVVP